jgi:fucose permease
MLLLHAGFILTGVVNTMLGPMLPALAARWKLSDARAGYLFTAQFTGSTLGVIGSSALMSRRMHRAALMLGLGFMAVGSAMLLASGWIPGIMAALLFGTGLGLAIPTTNLLVSELNPQRRAAALSLVNFSWGVGAAACSFLISAMLRAHRSFYFQYGVAALLILVAVSLTRDSFPIVSPTPENIGGVRTHFLGNGWMPVLGALFFLYVGCEAGLGGWTATYAQRITAGSGMMWVLMPSFFWAALLFGRATTPLLLRVVRESTLAQGGLGVSTLGLAALLAARNLFSVAIGVTLAGLGFSSVFPIAIAALSRKFGVNAPRIAGLMFALAGAGGATLPWLIGYLSTTLGNLKYGLLVPLFGCIVMLLLNGLLSKEDFPIADK